MKHWPSLILALLLALLCNSASAVMLDPQLQPVTCYDTCDHADRLIKRDDSTFATLTFQYDGEGQQ